MNRFSFPHSPNQEWLYKHSDDQCIEQAVRSFSQKIEVDLGSAHFIHGFGVGPSTGMIHVHEALNLA